VSIARECTARRVSNCYIGTRESAEPGETASKADLYLEEDRGRYGVGVVSIISDCVWRMHGGKKREKEREKAEEKLS